MSVTFIVGLGSLWGHPGNGPASFLVLLGLGLDWTCLVNCQLAQFSCFFPKCRMMLKFRLDSGLGFLDFDGISCRLAKQMKFWNTLKEKVMESLLRLAHSMENISVIPCIWK